MGTITIRAALKLANRDDIFLDEFPLTNKILFTRNPETKDFKGLIKIGKLCDTKQCNSIDELKSNRFQNGMLYAGLLEGIYRKEFYVLEELPSDRSFNFKIKLETAHSFDFFDSSDVLKQNTIYYHKINGDELRGPYTLKMTSQTDHIKKAIAQGILFVPMADQSFEPIITSRAS